MHGRALSLTSLLPWTLMDPTPPNPITTPTTTPPQRRTQTPSTTPSTSTQKRSRAWLMTRYEGHGDLSLPTCLVDPAMRYFTCQMERCPTTGRLHLQGFGYWNTIKSQRQVTRIWPCDARPVKPPVGKAIAYCQKEDTRVEGPVEFGDIPNQGKRTDLRDFYEATKEGKRKRELLEEFPGVIAKYPRFYEDVVALTRPHRDRPTVILLVGPPGTGKSYTARDMVHPLNYWVKPKGGGTWFDGYDGQPVALLDDFTGRGIPCAFLLELLDIWAVRVPVKGSFTWFNPKFLIITSNTHPSYWYRWDEEVDGHRHALYRRIHVVYEFSSFGVCDLHDTRWYPNCDTSTIPYLNY